MLVSSVCTVIGVACNALAQVDLEAFFFPVALDTCAGELGHLPVWDVYAVLSAFGLYVD